MDMSNYNFYDAFVFRRVLKDDYYEGKPLDFGNRTVLVAGDGVVEDVYRVYHEQQTPRLVSDEPILKPEYPWEGRGFELDGGIIYDEDEKLFKAWYSVCPPMQSPELSDWEKNLEAGNCPSCLCYAESEDMINWRKPMFTHCPLGSIKESNICFTGGSDGTRDGRVFLNMDKTDKENKFLMIYVELTGPRIASSPDGRVWHDVPGVNPLFPVNYDTHQNVIYDGDREKYLLYLRPSVFAKHESQPAEPVCPGLNYRRRITMTESSDLVDWTIPRIVQRAREDAEYDQCDHQYTFAIGGMLFARVSRFCVKKVSDAVHQNKVPWWSIGTDPKNMHFLDKDEPIPDCLSTDGSHTFGYSTLTGYPITVGGKTYFSMDQKVQIEGKKPTMHTMLAAFDENRIIARSADEYGGWLLTKEFILRGTEVEINCEVADGGSVTAEILYGQGGAVRGGQFIEDYRLADFDTITESGLHKKLSFNGSTNLGRFENQPIFIRFHLVNAKLYSFKVNE